MKRSNIILISISLLMFACNKLQYATKEIRDDCTIESNVDTAIVGKWKLLNWSAGHYNLNTCESIGGNTYDAETFNENITIEVQSNGIINIYDTDTLFKKCFITDKTTNNINYLGLNVNGGESVFGFYELNQLDTIFNTEIGDTLKISNPFVDLNFQNDVVRSLSGTQRYVKIE